MTLLSAFGLFAVTAMLVCHALEHRSSWFILAFAFSCGHAEEVLQFASRPLELPVYDWTAGGFLLIAGVLSRPDWSAVRRRGA